MNRSDQVNEIFTALAKAQGQIEDASKDSTNPHFKSKYADLAAVRDAIREPLSSNGIAYIQLPRTVAGGVEVETILGHSSGQFISETLMIPLPQMTAQTIGSATSYAKRYALMGMVGIAASEDDDDGNEASRTPYRPEARRPTVEVTSRVAPPSHTQTPFDDDEIPFSPNSGNFEPAVSTKAIALGREMKECKSIPDLNSFKRTQEFKTAFDAMNEVDKDYLIKMRNQLATDLADADFRMAG